MKRSQRGARVKLEWRGGLAGLRGRAKKELAKTEDNERERRTC